MNLCMDGCAGASGWLVLIFSLCANFHTGCVIGNPKSRTTLQKIQGGQYPMDTSSFSRTPILSQAINRILYWKGIAKCTNGDMISTTVLKQQASKGLLIFSDVHWTWNTVTITQHIQSVYDDYVAIKAQSDCRDTWLKQVIDAMATAQNIPKVWLWKQIHQIEAARTCMHQV